MSISRCSEASFYMALVLYIIGGGISAPGFHPSSRRGIRLGRDRGRSTLSRTCGLDGSPSRVTCADGIGCRLSCIFSIMMSNPLRFPADGARRSTSNLQWFRSVYHVFPVKPLSKTAWSLSNQAACAAISPRTDASRRCDTCHIAQQVRHASPFDHQDAVGLDDGSQPVGDGDDRHAPAPVAATPPDGF